MGGGYVVENKSRTSKNLSFITTLISNRLLEVSLYLFGSETPLSLWVVIASVLVLGKTIVGVQNLHVVRRERLRVVMVVVKWDSMDLRCHQPYTTKVVHELAHFLQ